MRLTSIIAFFLANLAIATPIEESSNNVASEADIARCSRRYDICIEVNPQNLTVVETTWANTAEIDATETFAID
ncbi:hypothetical protein N7513_009306 [Penicillium frequentans]|nr:hypothetical protein N7513_009306 [Penicillium glabrum]